jgi:hypothetical protein
MLGVVERPRLVHMLVFGVQTRKDLCAQAIVRIHLKQVWPLTRNMVLFTIHHG